MRKHRGFTLLELLIALAIIGILAAVTLPNYSAWIDKYSTSTNVRAFMHTLQFARYQALKSGVDITLCPTSNSTCTSNWNDPINVFQDKDKDQRISKNEQILMSTHILREQNSVITRSGTGNHIKFNWKGHAFGSATTFVVCAKESNQSSRQVIINFQGRIRSQHYLSRNGNPYASLNGLRCNQM